MSAKVFQVKQIMVGFGAPKLTGPEYPGTNPRSTSFSFEQGQAALGSEVTDK